MSSSLQRDDSPAEKILKLLRQQATWNLRDLALALGVTRTAVRQQLIALCAQELVTTALVREGRGRPHLAYSLSDKGRAHLPQLSAELACILLEAVLQPAGSAGGDDLWQQISARLGEQYAERLRGTTLAARLRELVVWLEAQGIVTTTYCEPDASVLVAYGCPYYDVARTHRAMCRLESAALEQALGTSVTLVLSQLDGYQCCTFRIATLSAERDDPHNTHL
jgi:DeoR family suf operon transcriptional repressor